VARRRSAFSREDGQADTAQVPKVEWASRPFIPLLYRFSQSLKVSVYSVYSVYSVFSVVPIRPYAENLPEPAIAEPGMFYCCSMPHRQASFVPSGSRREQATPLRRPTRIPLLTNSPKVHLALLHVTPQAPRDGGMSAAPNAKEEIALTVRSVPLRSRHRKFFLVRAVWVAAITATARFSRLCVPPPVSFRLRFSSFRCVFAVKPASAAPGSSTQIRLKRFNCTPEARLIRPAQGSPVVGSLANLQPFGPDFLRGPTACPAGLWSLRPHPGGSFAATLQQNLPGRSGRLLCNLSLSCGGGPARCRARNPAERSKSHNRGYAFAVHISLSCARRA